MVIDSSAEKVAAKVVTEYDAEREQSQLRKERLEINLRSLLHLRKDIKSLPSRSMIKL